MVGRDFTYQRTSVVETTDHTGEPWRAALFTAFHLFSHRREASLVTKLASEQREQSPARLAF